MNTPATDQRIAYALRDYSARLVPADSHRAARIRARVAYYQRTGEVQTAQPRLKYPILRATIVTVILLVVALIGNPESTQDIARIHIPIAYADDCFDHGALSPEAYANQCPRVLFYDEAFDTGEIYLVQANPLDWEKAVRGSQYPYNWTPTSSRPTMWPTAKPGAEIQISWSSFNHSEYLWGYSLNSVFLSIPGTDDYPSVGVMQCGVNGTRRTDLLYSYLQLPCP